MSAAEAAARGSYEARDQKTWVQGDVYSGGVQIACSLDQCMVNGPKYPAHNPDGKYIYTRDVEPYQPLPLDIALAFDAHVAGHKR